MNLPLQVYFGVSLDQGIHSAVERTPLLLEHQFGADDARRGDEREPSDLVLLGRGEQSHPAPLTMPDCDDPLPVDIRTLVQISDHGPDVVGVVLECRRFRAPAAQADASLIVASN